MVRINEGYNMSSKNTKMKHFKKHEKNKNKSKWE